jgi:iron complex transport system substrate-binding protein
MFSLSSRRWIQSVMLSLLLPTVAFQLVACGANANQVSSSSSSEIAYQPLTIQSCGKTLSFTKAPTRVISTLQSTTDILLTLGLGSRIMGIYYGQLYQSEPEFNSQYAQLDDLGGDMGSVPAKEIVLSTHPDFVFSAYPAGDFLASYGEVTREQFEAQGAQIYGMSGECSDDSTQVRATSVYDDILNIGRIFGVEARAQSLVDTMKARIAVVQKHVANLPASPVIAMPVFSSTQAAPPLTVVGAGIYSDILRLAGGNNLYGTQNKTYPSINQESFVTQKPAGYVLICYKGADQSKFTSYLFSAFPENPATKQQRTIAIEDSHWNAGVFLPDTIEKLARFFHPEAFR